MTTTAILEDFKRLEQLYAKGFHDTFLDSALRKIIERQIARDEADLKRVNEGLAEFERQYGLTSTEFWQRFQAGQMDNTADFMEWNVLCKMQQRVASRLSILRGDASRE